MKIHEKIRQLRLEKGYSQEVMAEELDLSTTAYGDVERGKTELTLARLERILQVLGVGVEAFFGLPGDNTLRLENEKLQIENEKLRQENTYLKEKFETRLLQELYRIGAASQREPIGFK
ncbi:helix-turn-helix domain-containing protein [Siphonobacter aquaeclarae]|jgi:transcriptional regulator with XRE-family HTH domain|uniref:DNA-binding transcriptional regulator, XRE-family HTH domain n=1 Tax=Siphonobacter aquaeclarae TaxID=563176 RepID=A0A1G9XG87_9BACT|nr:helix-turn-helix transcriptional regulator [Siphonobacter aquaeclarae]MBO9636976.1 helix-turn-helix transcriptional regulator [Siphonobacter aquaeclarae]SDM95754.1 DNA-binding transcriptional regulator, XRE-family HTH domain [Siphonobacter aquaeclarae]